MEKLITRKEAAEILGLCVFYCGGSPGVYRKMYAQGKAC